MFLFANFRNVCCNLMHSYNLTTFCTQKLHCIFSQSELSIFFLQGVVMELVEIIGFYFVCFMPINCMYENTPRKYSL